MGWRVPRIVSTLIAVLLMLATAGAASDSALAAGWSIQSTPNPAVTSAVSDVSCAAVTACTAVGNYFDSYGRQVMLAEQWNGTAWAIPPTTNPPGVVDSALTGVSCTAATACTAVGNGLNNMDNDVTLAGRWNGIAWGIQTVSTPAYSVLSGVSCAAADACTAVGESDISSTGALTLVEAWNGSTWALQTTPNPSGATSSALSGVSCTGTACIAVGHYIDSSGAQLTLAEQWSGTAWAIQTTPGTGLLSSVSCTASTACVAVGRSGGGTLAEAWNGTAWAIKTTPNPTRATSSVLSGVSCAGVGCIAVGHYVNSSGNQVTLAEQWNGTAWAIKTTPNPTGATSTVLSGASCTAANACIAVGDDVNALGTDVTLAERYSG